MGQPPVVGSGAASRARGDDKRRDVWLIVLKGNGSSLLRFSTPALWFVHTTRGHHHPPFLPSSSSILTLHSHPSSSRVRASHALHPHKKLLFPSFVVKGSRNILCSSFCFACLRIVNLCVCRILGLETDEGVEAFLGCGRQCWCCAGCIINELNN